MPRHRRRNNDDDEVAFARLQGFPSDLDENDNGEEDDDYEDDEVFALQGVSSDSSENEDEDDAQNQGYDDSGSTSTRKNSRVTPKSTFNGSESEEEEEEEEEEETWGRSKGAYYASNAAQIDSEDEEANELEEQEALRLQAKAYEGMCDEDFGLGVVVEGEGQEEDDVEQPEATEQERIPNPRLTSAPQDRQSAVRSLEKESPETLALARDWDDTARSLVEAKVRVEALTHTETDALELGLQHLYFQALLTYTTTLAFYLHLRATEKYAARPQLLRQHPILKRLLTLKEGINTLETLGVGQDTPDGDENGEEEDQEEDELMDDDDGDLWSLIKTKGLESGELADLLEDAGLPTPRPSRSPSPPLPLPSASTKRSTPKKGRRAESDRKKKGRETTISDRGRQAPAFDLIEPEYPRAPRKQRQAVPVALDTHAGASDPFGEVSVLGYHDVSDKRARKKSLRFHVSRIEASSSRRTNARVNAFGGDDDIPYRERRKARDARLEREKERKKEKGQLGAGGDDLDDVDLEVDGGGEQKKRKRKREPDDDDDDDVDDDVRDANGYYDLVKQATATKKARRKAAYDAATARLEAEPENSSGPRSVTRAILKNKGLTPRRSKAVRNPRVKKRQKFEQAKKKVASQKAVYKGGIRDVSRYSGEQSGISKVVKSVRL